MVKDENDNCPQIRTVLRMCGRAICVGSVEYAAVNGVRQAEIHMAERIALKAEIAIENINVY